MSYHTKPGIITQHTAKLRRRFFGSVGNDDHTGMYAVPHAYTAAVVQAHPTCTACCVYECIEYWPVGNCITSVQHCFCFAVGARNRAGVEMVASNNNRGFYFSGSYQFIKCKTCFFSFALPQPTNTCRQPLKRNFFICKINPA